MKISLPHLLLFFLLFVASRVSPEYTRPDPRPLIFRPHYRSDAEPQQVHISVAGNDHMRVSWITSDKKVKSVVEYGKTPGNTRRRPPERVLRINTSSTVQVKSTM
ncbi:Purple acid phosphatase 22 [Sesamum angolense]|uniref:Purple acid phosphatase 22 n=1 Tax=Sesamum angolense TaxID=2727404 RepID=A0AAE1WNA7_9LAMI|nr:Purple acid phosphatase 22 [Sesamum angolense]